MKMTPDCDNDDTGRNLAQRLTQFSSRPDVIVLAISPASTAVAAAIAWNLKIDFDVLQVGNITAPSSGDHTIGAITGDGFRIFNYDLIDRLRLSDADVRDATLKATSELVRRDSYHHRHPPTLDLQDHTVLLVDDGTTRGSTMQTAIRLLRRQHVDRVLVVLACADRHVACDLGLEADEWVTLTEPGPALVIGNWFKPCYSRGPQTCTV